MFEVTVPPDFEVHTNEKFLQLGSIFSVIHKRRGKKLIRKTIKHKLDNSSKIQFAFFYPKDIQIFIIFLENYHFYLKSGNDANSWGRRGVMFFASL